MDNLELIEPYRLVLWLTIEEKVPIVMLSDGLRVKSVFVRNIGSLDAYMKSEMLLKVPKLVYQELRMRTRKTTLVPPSSFILLRYYVCNSYIDICVVVYIDDVFIHNTSLRAHKEHLMFSTPRLEYLDHIFYPCAPCPYCVLCHLFVVTSKGVRGVDEISAREKTLHVIQQPTSLQRKII